MKKILIEKTEKEELPIDFMTAFISKGWDEIGGLKAQRDAIKQSYKGTAKVEKILQDLIDAYLICVGQMELHLHDKDYIEYPDDANIKIVEEDDKKNEALTEDLVDDEVQRLSDKAAEVETPAEEDTFLNDVAETAKAMPTAEKADEFEYTCDFPEPDLTDEDKRAYEDSLENIR